MNLIKLEHAPGDATKSSSAATHGPAIMKKSKKHKTKENKTKEKKTQKINQLLKY